MSPRRPARALLAVLAATSLVAACSDDDSTEVTSDQPTTTDAPAPAIEVTGVWARTSPKMATAGAVYATIVNDGDLDDALLSAAVDPSVAAAVEVHETVPADGVTTTAMDSEMGDGEMGDGEMGDDGMDGGDPGGMMTMQPVERIEIPAGGSVALEPGGYHIMLLDVVAPLEVGGTIEVTLTFEEAGEVVVTAEVRDTAP